MKKPIIKIIDIDTNSEIDREMNDAEFEQYKLDQANVLAEKTKAEAEGKAKSIAKAAILDRLGLTADELKTILG
jgi:hypothetical protein